MGKIPVGRTIGYAYSFAFGHFATLLGLVWFPFLVMMLSAYPLLRPSLRVVRLAMVMEDSSAILGTLPLLLLAGAAFTGFVMMSVGVTREALGLRRGVAFVSFPVDATLWRLLRAYVTVGLILIGVLTAGLAAVAVLALIVNALFGAIHAGVVAGASAVMTGVLFVYVLVRLGFFLVPVTVAEGDRPVRRAWRLSQDNFWRIVLVIAALIVPIAALPPVCDALFAPALPAPPEPGASTDVITALLSRFEAGLFSDWLLLSAIALLVLTLQMGLTAGASAFAYRALAGRPRKRTDIPAAGG